MKILILGMLEAGKSTVSYYLSQKYGLPRLNLDEVSRDPETGGYNPPQKQQKMIRNFIQQHDSFISEGCQKELYTQIPADIIIVISTSRLKAAWQFTWRFLKAKKLKGKKINPSLPVQAYHYRKVTLGKIGDWDKCNRQIKNEIQQFILNKKVFYVSSKKAYEKLKIMEKGSL